MAKNPVDKNRRPKDNFFQKSGKNFHKPKFQHKTEECSTESSNFFLKSDNPSTSSSTKVSKPQDTQGKGETKTDKKPFDKKKYRLQKYSKKYQLQQWEDKRKKAVLRSYYKSIKEDQPDPVNLVDESSAVQKEKDDTEDTEKSVDTEETSKGKRLKPFRKAHEEFHRIREEKEKKRELFLQRKKEKEEAAQKYKKNKVEKFKKLNKKTKKGQPIMKDRLEMLLERIQRSIQQE